MKKLFSIAICLAMLLSVLTLASCTKKTYKIAVVTDVGTLNDKGFNQGTWEGAEKYGKDPYVWDDNVAEYIRMKNDPEYYNDPVCKHGYLRGSETFNYVREVMERYNYYLHKTGKK